MNTHRSFGQDAICRFSLLGLLILFGLAGPSLGQVKTDSLPEVKIISTRYQVAAISQPQQVMILGTDVLEMTSARDLVTLLSMYGHAYLRSNGPGLASGITQRGFGTTSLQVVRDGFTLNQPMHGQVDMALIPVLSLGFAEIATANASSTFGSAAPGGSLSIGSNWNQGWSVSHERGPWGYQESAGSIVANMAGSTYLLKAGATSSNNDFTYEDQDENATLRRENSSLDRKWIQFGTMTKSRDIYLRTNIYAHVADREIPDPINFLGTEGFQEDEEVRFTAELTGLKNTPNWSVRTQIWQSKLLYSDVWLVDRSYNRVRGASMGAQYDVSPFSWLNMTAALGGELVDVETNNYEAQTSRNAMNGTLRSLISAPMGLLLFPSFRLDAIEDIGSALSPSLGLNKTIIPNILHARSQWSYNFTAPTLNDQFWLYGGNSTLEPERAHKADLGLHWKTKFGTSEVDWQGQAFATRAVNGIIWQPRPDGFWSPVNLQEMHGHGMEQSLKVATSFREVNIHAGSQVTWSRAYIPKARYDGDAAVKKQLRYTPEWMLRFQAGATYRNVQINTEVSRDGKRFSSEDHSSSLDPLPASTLVNVSGQLRLPSRNFEPSLRLSMVNALDVKYSTLAWYPMPGRHLLIALRVRRN
jgi:vitamin B12 transporter